MEELKKVACDPVFECVYNWGIDRVVDNYDKQLAKLHLGVFQDGWLVCLKELGVSPEHLAWGVAPLVVELVDLVLLGFNEHCCWRMGQTRSWRRPPR